MKSISKPQPGDYAPYAVMYVDLLPDDGWVLDHLKESLEATKALLGALPDSKTTARCAEGEWTIKEILVHVIDTERVFAYRALRFARGDATELAGFEQDNYVSLSGANERNIADILEEYAAVRLASLTLFEGFPDAAFTRKGSANGHPMSVCAAAYLIAGHEQHHLNSIKENYLSG